MNIIIPLGGTGERFKSKGFKEPKPLINILDKKMIEYVLDNINIRDNDKVFIIYNKKLNDFNFVDSLPYNFITYIEINDTKGAAETLYNGIDIIKNNYSYHTKSLILDCDTFYTEDIIKKFDDCNSNVIFFTKKYEEDPIYSYIKMNETNLISDIMEKKKISDNANTGAYAFQDINVLYSYCKIVIENNITFNNEPYTSCVISEMIKKNETFHGIELDNKYVFSLGTPDDVDKYINDTFICMFDLDGTLVLTDELYKNVWGEILQKYNLNLNDEIFTNVIQGNSDKYVKEYLFPNKNITLSELSNIKDSLFLQNINKIKVIEGVHSFLSQLRKNGYKICIVTNCNKKSAEEIIKLYKIDTDFIIASDDCTNNKPDKEPYENALNKFTYRGKKIAIFEDSKSGLLSAKLNHPQILIGIETIYTATELKSNGVNNSIVNYKDVLFEDLLCENKLLDNLEHMVSNSLSISIKDVFITNEYLKGGFIADVIKIDCLINNNKIPLIIKIENNNGNNLSIMAKQLELYDREYYFYKNISQDVNVKLPKFYNLLKDNNLKDKGIILENLFNKGYKINLNLNEESIDVSLKIVNKMAQLHSKFWNKNLKEIYPFLKHSKSECFYPFKQNFIKNNSNKFLNKWKHCLSEKQINICSNLINNFENIQEKMNTENLTFIHGDIKSPNLFYDTDNNLEPYFLDWQHCAIGKGSQDLIFFIIESFDITKILQVYNLFKYYYFIKIKENGIHYSWESYSDDLYTSICYIPFFTAIWFGSLDDDELLDKNFPYFFINKLFYLLEYLHQ